MLKQLYFESGFGLGKKAAGVEQIELEKLRGEKSLFRVEMQTVDVQDKEDKNTTDHRYL